MRRTGSLGLLGRMLAILLLIVAFEFTASTFLYERASRALIRDDEAHRLADHLVIARKLLSGQATADRPAMAALLTTSRYAIGWSGRMPPMRGADAAPIAARVIEWEPTLAPGDLRLVLVPHRPGALLAGGLRLADGSWLRFSAAVPDENATALHRMLLGLLPAALVLAIGALLFRRTLRPIAALADATEHVGRGGGVTVPEDGPGEVRRLIRAFNAMQARIRQLIDDRTQALAAVGHDLRTPLARLRLRSDAIGDTSLRRAVRGDVGEMDAMVGSLLAYLGGEADPEPAALADIAVLAATIVDDAQDRGGDVRYRGPDHLETRVRTVGLKRALGNLVENALHYGTSAIVTLAERPGSLILRVEDDGPGIAPDRIGDALRPFSRLDPARGRNTGGLGLGLAIVARFAEGEGGSLHLENRPEGGLRAELRLSRR